MATVSKYVYYFYSDVRYAYFMSQIFNKDFLMKLNFPLDIVYIKRTSLHPFLKSSVFYFYF